MHYSRIDYRDFWPWTHHYQLPLRPSRMPREQTGIGAKLWWSKEHPVWRSHHVSAGPLRCSEDQRAARAAGRWRQNKWHHQVQWQGEYVTQRQTGTLNKESDFMRTQRQFCIYHVDYISSYSSRKLNSLSLSGITVSPTISVFSSFRGCRRLQRRCWFQIK